ncbi:MAG: Hpt domain-containing protein [Verrucomicrobia bacterium]|nr:Hpt domain-containing protein [Verrucomicrobiota bacterium]
MEEPEDILRFRATIPDLSRDLGTEGAGQLLQSFLADSASRFESLDGLLRVGDLAGLGRCAHSIKGSSSIFGLDDLGRRALEVELAARSLEIDRLPGLVADLRASYTPLEPFLRAVQGEPAGRAGG